MKYLAVIILIAMTSLCGFFTPTVATCKCKVCQITTTNDCKSSALTLDYVDCVDKQCYDVTIQKGEVYSGILRGCLTNASDVGCAEALRLDKFGPLSYPYFTSPLKNWRPLVSVSPHDLNGPKLSRPTEFYSVTRRGSPALAIATATGYTMINGICHYCKDASGCNNHPYVLVPSTTKPPSSGNNTDSGNEHPSLTGSVVQIPQIDCPPDNILLRIRIFIPGNGKVKKIFEHHTLNIK